MKTNGATPVWPVRILVGVILACLAHCAPNDAKPEVRLYAAASLADVMRELSARFESESHVRVIASYGASNVLAQQIHEGASPGVFVSASAEWAERLEAWGDAEPGTRVALLTNSLVVVVPKSADAPPRRLEDLADPRFARIALADPAAVPAGTYAKAALESAKVYDVVRSRLVAAPDVRAALAYVERGDADAGIVYVTDAVKSDAVEVAFHVAADLHPRIDYPMLLIRGSAAPARSLHAFLQSAAARAVYARSGFR
jgi:molybdate transport system substrate-binding protein